jgi:hypothetical protein
LNQALSITFLAIDMCSNTSSIVFKSVLMPFLLRNSSTKILSREDIFMDSPFGKLTLSGVKALMIARNSDFPESLISIWTLTSTG